MDFVIFIGIAQALFLSALLGGKKSRQAFDYILITWLVLNALSLYFFHLNFEGRTAENTPLLLVGSILAYLISPLLYLYVCALINQEPFRLGRYAYHFIPYIFFSCSLLYYYFLDNVQNTIWVEQGYIHMIGKFPFHMRYISLIMAFSSFIYPVWSLLILFKHRSRIEEEFSYIEKINLDWLRYWIIISMAGFLITFGIIWIGIFEWIDIIFSFKITAGLIVSNIFIIGFFGLKQTTVFSDYSIARELVNKNEAPDKYKGSKLGEEVLNSHAKALTAYMIKEKPYLDSKLSLDQLADSLNISKHSLSQVINETTGSNFFYFVNRYRVEEFKRRLVDPALSHLTLLGIALDTGFNSKSSFNAVFKRIEGLTPSEYKQKIVGK